MNDDSLVILGSPLYLVKSFEQCWKCHNVQRVIALASRHVRASGFDQLDAAITARPVFLTNITEMPSLIWEYLSAAYPQFQKRHSKMADMVYFANTCGVCAANFGDFFLFSEPEGAFFPCEEQAARMSIVELPFTGLHEFRCSWHLGGSFIFKHAAKEGLA